MLKLLTSLDVADFLQPPPDTHQSMISGKQSSLNSINIQVIIVLFHYLQIAPDCDYYEGAEMASEVWCW